MAHVRAAHHHDLLQMLNIYNSAILTTTATFDLEPFTLEQRREWFLHHHPDKHPILVAEVDEHVVGYASLSPFRDKPAYGNTVESSVYVDPSYHGRGIGKLLMTSLLERARQLGYHCIIAGITSGNDASIALHEHFGFELVGHLREVGHKFGEWQDVLFYQVILSGEVIS